MMNEIDETEEEEVIGGTIQWPGECDPFSSTGPTFPPWPPTECPWW
jgi:hypothetical protein